MAISQPNCNCQKAPKGPGPNLKPKWPFQSQIVIARKARMAFLQPWPKGSGPSKGGGVKGNTFRHSAPSGMVPPQGWCQARGPLPGKEPPPLAVGRSSASAGAHQVRA